MTIGEPCRPMRPDDESMQALARVAATRTASPGGTKHDTGKDPWDLLPWDAVREIVKILAFGASKYAPRNWEKGIVYSRLFAALQRHALAWWEREDRDPETGRSHLAHAACCVCFLLAFVLRGRVDLDDRPEALPKPAEFPEQKAVQP